MRGKKRTGSISVFGKMLVAQSFLAVPPKDPFSELPGN